MKKKELRSKLVHAYADLAILQGENSLLRSEVERLKNKYMDCSIDKDTLMEQRDALRSRIKELEESIKFCSGSCRIPEEEAKGGGA